MQRTWYMYSQKIPDDNSIIYSGHFPSFRVLKAFEQNLQKKEDFYKNQKKKKKRKKEKN